MWTCRKGRQATYIEGSIINRGAEGVGGGTFKVQRVETREAVGHKERKVDSRVILMPGPLQN